MNIPHHTAVLCAAATLCVLLASGAPYAGPPQKKQNDAAAAAAASASSKPHDSVDQAGYRIEQPGTITFTVGMVIKGKLEKPQVMIFLPKERTFYREQKFTHSFADDLSEPLPFSPILG